VTITQESPKKRLLALDDHPDSAELIARVATKCGYEARSIADPRALGNVLREWKPEVLTLDLCMPQEDGIAVLTTLKDAGFAGRVIIISGQDDWLRKSAGRLAEARGIKVVEDVSKPVDLAMLRDLLMKLHTMH
jgi:two-component system chemotaxis response regulator CheB